MARRTMDVTYTTTDETRVPDALTEGAMLLMELSKRGVVDTVGERVHIRRQGGYSGLDVFLGLLVFFASGAVGGLRPFWEKHRGPLRRVGALAGRRSLPSPASLSRALNSVEAELLRADGTAAWLLSGVAEVDKVMGHPATRTCDARGGGWHVFDLDPTVTTLRHRALPEDEELPEPRRRSEATGAPGHSGRKRGDLQFRRITVQHAGSGAWVHAHLSPGNGEGVVDFERALDTVVATCKRLSVPHEQVMVRMDGEYGNVPWYTACRERGLRFVTRLNRPKLYQDPAVLERLRAATWHQVPSSGCEPQRAAADLGELTVAPGERTRRPDGRIYEPVTVRVAASIFPKNGKAKRGATLDGWQVELFAVDLPADAWPAPEAIAVYFGRAAQENRFAQEDREVGLDRILSYHLPGQELASLVGLSLWNLRLVRGFELEPPPGEAPVQAPRRAEVDERVPEYWPRDPVLLDFLKELEWPVLLAKRPGWSYDLATDTLRCDDGKSLTLTSVRSKEHAPGRIGVIFRRATGGCEACPARSDCLKTERPGASKHFEVVLSTEAADPIRQRLALIRADSATDNIKPIAVEKGPLAVHTALFLPGAARRVAVAILDDATFRIKVELPPPRPARPRLVAVDEADRQRRRKTWTDNVERYALPEGAHVSVEIAAPAKLQAFLGEPRGSKRAAKSQE